MEAKETKMQSAGPRGGGAPTTTISGQLQNALGFWFALSLFEGTAWLIWLCYQLIGYFYFYTKPLDTFGRGIPW